MSRGRHCEYVDLGEPYGVARLQLAKPWATFTDAEKSKLIAAMRNVYAAAERKFEGQQ